MGAGPYGAQDAQAGVCASAQEERGVLMGHGPLWALEHPGWACGPMQGAPRLGTSCPCAKRALMGAGVFCAKGKMHP